MSRTQNRFFFFFFRSSVFSLLLRLLKIRRSSNFFFRRTLSAMLLLLFTIPVKTKVVFVNCSCRYFEILNTIMHTMLIVPLSFRYRSVKTKLNQSTVTCNQVTKSTGPVLKTNTIYRINFIFVFICRGVRK